jgi:hypothetical protein
MKRESQWPPFSLSGKFVADGTSGGGKKAAAAVERMANTRVNQTNQMEREKWGKNVKI